MQVHTLLPIPGWQWASKWYAAPARRATALAVSPKTAPRGGSIPDAARGKTTRRAATPELTQQDDTAFLEWLAGEIGRELDDKGITAEAADGTTA